ncbi:IPT/TIG domain-containing protein [Streptomyces sp. FH025]|uniref:IPT/TIG domain-containing protein n=1 Tax=Streptomyces sp. FH025 TaxID=2815937 RepID=UPI001A9CF261|nr:IPT/TIG domain-containing protein [Streptomyces sp. FH025]MBO1414624.1 IPT/TIG domain-containing protein [Streptomyces sp. FH025]
MTAIPARRTAALLATATTTFGLLAGASPAHAASAVQIAGPAGPVPANTPYTVTIDVPNTNPMPNANATMVNVTLSGAAATVTSAKASSQIWDCNFSAGSSGMCWNLANQATPSSLTLTVLPTAAGTVTTLADARNDMNQAVGSDTLNTQVEAPAPVVTGLAPDHGPQAGGTTVTLTGSHLTGATAVSFGSTAATSFTVDSDTRITATVPAASTAGTVDVTVTTPAGTSAAGKYTYEAPAPVVTGLAPDHGPLGGGTTVTLTGSHLTGATAVSFGSTAATSFTVDSDTRITATVPAGSAPGAVDVTVTTPAGTGAAGKYTYQDPATTGSYVFSQTSDPTSGSTVKTGDKVTYTVTVAQKGADEVKGATVTDDLSKVLDDAAYNGDAKATSGTAEVKDGKLTWTGDLPVGGSATVTYSVTVNGNGDHQLHTAVTTPDDKRGTCDTEKGCATDHTVQAASTPSPTPTPTDGGQTPGTPVPGPSTTEGSSTPSTPWTSPDTQAPAASAPSQASGVLASTGTTAFTTAATSGALLVLGGLTIALSRRRRRHG